MNIIFNHFHGHQYYIHIMTLDWIIIACDLGYCTNYSISLICTIILALKSRPTCSLPEGNIFI